MPTRNTDTSVSSSPRRRKSSGMLAASVKVTKNTVIHFCIFIKASVVKTRKNYVHICTATNNMEQNCTERINTSAKAYLATSYQFVPFLRFVRFRFLFRRSIFRTRIIIKFLQSQSYIAIQQNHLLPHPNSFHHSDFSGTGFASVASSSIKSRARTRR